MGEGTKIEWAHHTFNPWIGCQKVSPGCANCYAEVNTFTRAQRALGRELWGPNADRHIVSEAKWREPERWNRDAAAAGERHRVFCASMADAFEDHGNEILQARRRLWALIQATPNLDWLLLTKRPENIERFVPSHWLDGQWPRNAWAGVSAEDQVRADLRIPLLLKVHAHIPVRFVSYEPALGPVDFKPFLWSPKPTPATCRHETRRELGMPGIDWLLLGGESGPAPRGCDVTWIRSGVAQCRAAHCAAFVKQFGGRSYEDRDTSEPDCAGPTLPTSIFLKDRKGGDPAEWPAGDWPRDFPSVAR